MSKLSWRSSSAPLYGIALGIVAASMVAGALLGASSATAQPRPGPIALGGGLPANPLAYDASVGQHIEGATCTVRSLFWDGGQNPVFIGYFTCPGAPSDLRIQAPDPGSQTMVSNAYYAGRPLVVSASHPAHTEYVLTSLSSR